jgi:hypothetical protein
MLDMDAVRFDLAASIRDARRRRDRRTRWLGVVIKFDEARDRVHLGPPLGMDLDVERSITTLPSGARASAVPLVRCPRGCGARVRVLWLTEERPPTLACRECAGVRYASAATSSELVRASIAYSRVREKLGLPDLHSLVSFICRGRRGARYPRDRELLESATSRLNGAEAKPTRSIGARAEAMRYRARFDS